LLHAVRFAIGGDDGCLGREPVEHVDGGGVLWQKRPEEPKAQSEANPVDEDVDVIPEARRHRP